MDSPHCWLCDVPIDESLRDKEHIIPEALGGRRTVTDFICKKCNNDTGSKWDAPLVESMRPLISIACADPHGKGRPSIRQIAGGGMVEQCPDGRWIIAPDRPLRLASRIADREFEVHGHPGFDNRTREVKQFKEWIESFSYLDVGFDVKEISSAIRVEPKVFDGQVEAYHEVVIGDRASVRSMLKSILALAFEAGADSSDCLPLLAYLRGEATDFPYVLYGVYGGKDVVRNRSGETLYCVHVRGDQKNGELIAYGEMSGYRIVLAISRNYIGPAFTSTYAVDVVGRQEKETECDLKGSMVLAAEWLMPVYGIDDYDHWKWLLLASLDGQVSKWFKRTDFRIRKYLERNSSELLPPNEVLLEAVCFADDCHEVLSNVFDEYQLDVTGLKDFRSNVVARLQLLASAMGTIIPFKSPAIIR